MRGSRWLSGFSSGGEYEKRASASDHKWKYNHQVEHNNDGPSNKAHALVQAGKMRSIARQATLKKPDRDYPAVDRRQNKDDQTNQHPCYPSVNIRAGNDDDAVRSDDRQ